MHLARSTFVTAVPVELETEEYGIYGVFLFFCGNYVSNWLEVGHAIPIWKAYDLRFDTISLVSSKSLSQMTYVMHAS